MGTLDNDYQKRIAALQSRMDDQCCEHDMVSTFELTMADVKKWYKAGKIDFVRSLELQLETVEYKALKERIEQ